MLLLISTNVLFFSYKDTQVTELTAIIRVVGPGVTLNERLSLQRSQPERYRVYLLIQADITSEWRHMCTFCLSSVRKHIHKTELKPALLT